MRRDWALELRGRRGFVLPVLAAALLGPASAVPVPGLGGQPGPYTVSGEVPAEVASIPGVQVIEKGGNLRFQRADDGVLLAVGGRPPDEIRAALDGGTSAVDVVDVFVPWRLPGRTTLLALISASVLTGAIAESLPGERSRKTLESLLTAAVTRLEIVLGKWAAWALFGSGAALLAAVLALVVGTAKPGMWLLPLPTVAMGTVALGLFLVRRARDVVAGATLAIRVLPALLSVLGILAWVVGRRHPELGALVPLGGALIAAGDTWPGVLPPVLATVSTLAATAGCVALTTRDLEQPAPIRGLEAGRLRAWLWTVPLAALAWWVPVLGPLAWGPAGNPGLTASLPRGPGVLAGAFGLSMIAALRAGAAREPAGSLGFRTSPWPPLVAAPFVAVLLAAVDLLHWPTFPEGSWAMAQDRLALDGVGLPIAIVALAAVAQEVLWRGCVQQAAGPWLAALGFLFVHGLLDPLHAVLVSAALGGLTHWAGGSVWPPVVAHLGWVVLARGVAG